MFTVHTVQSREERITHKPVKEFIFYHSMIWFKDLQVSDVIFIPHVILRYIF